MADIMDTPCIRCGKPLGQEVFLGTVHGKCARAAHAEVIGGKPKPQPKKPGRTGAKSSG